jgi:hypothetical protein
MEKALQDLAMKLAQAEMNETIARTQLVEAQEKISELEKALEGKVN